NRDLLQQKLHERGIPTAVHYPIPLHLQPVFSHLQYLRGSFPVSEKAAAEVISLPMHPYLEAQEQEKIAAAVAEICASFS
ncbi:MAG: DegT/DnrJ/EryC1/StrS family aminotransferase, partial [Turneriella sp.]|nr:DegT/DnrJ/EryC1/StrS family aminotransferase [Turneriella sp.]